MKQQTILNIPNINKVKSSPTIAPIKRKCNICNKWLSLDKFHKHKNKKGGLQYHCKKCQSILSKTLHTKEYMIKYDKNRNKAKAKYDVYAHQFSWCEEIRRDSNNKELLQIRCTESNCKRWFNPTASQAKHRSQSIRGIMLGESRFYCSDECKDICPIYAQRLYTKDNKPYYRREVQPELRAMVLERDNYECQRCGSTEELICHHYEGIEQNPIMSADIDMCVTLCKICNKLAHKDKGCRRVDLTKRSICNDNMS